MSVLQKDARQKMLSLSKKLFEIESMDIQQLKEVKAEIFNSCGTILFYASSEDEGNALQVILTLIDEIKARESEMARGKR